MKCASCEYCEISLDDFRERAKCKLVNDKYPSGKPILRHRSARVLVSEIKFTEFGSEDDDSVYESRHSWWFKNELQNKKTPRWCPLK